MPSKPFVKLLLFVAALNLLALSLLFPELFIKALLIADSGLAKCSPVLPFVPLVLYAVLGTAIRTYLWKSPRDATALALDRPEASSLTLAGFCFTSLSFLLGFFKDELKKGDTTPERILFFFASALGCFIVAYMVLRFRTKNLSLILNQAFLDNGLWCVLVGFWAFSRQITALSGLLIVFTFFILVRGIWCFISGTG